MRKVIYKEWVHETLGTDITNTKGYSVDKVGWLHGFFPTAMENNDGSFGNFTEALIELEDGSMVNVDPPLIRFVDKPEAEQLAEFAKAAMQGLLENTLIVRGHSSEEGIRWISEHAIMQAKSLIAKLNKHEPVESTGYTTPYLRIEQEQAYERMEALGINIHAQTFEQCVNDLLYRLENNNSPEPE